MDNLDETLKGILNNADWYHDGLNPSGNEDRDEAVEAIKQAFKDAGYRHNMAAGYWSREAEREGLMTGQEWYDRFDQQMGGKVFPWVKSDDEVINILSIVQDAAKKAAGIE